MNKRISFHLRSIRALPLLALLLTGILQELYSRENLIPTLEEVIGPPPEKVDLVSKKPRETFYSVVSSEESAEIQELIQQQRMGIELTEEEQQVMKDYQLGGNVSAANSVMRRIFPPVLDWVESNLKVASGSRYPFMNCKPHADGPFPVALVLDPEIAQQFSVGTEEYNQVVRRMPVREDQELPWEEPYRGRYITHSPLGNQLMSHAISVIIPIRQSLEKANEISMEDWKSVMDFYMDKKYLEPKSLFLVATKEYAGLAIRLASAYPFVGLILEEPEAGIFGAQFPADSSDAVKMLALRETYLDGLKTLQCHTLLFRHRNNPAIQMNDILILKTLIEMKRPLYMSMTDFAFRSLETPKDDEGEKQLDSRFLYDADSAKKLTQRMLYFVQKNGITPLNLLPEESTEPRSQNRAGGIINQFEQMTKRLNSLTGGSASGDGGFDDSGGDAGSSTGDENQ